MRDSDLKFGCNYYTETEGALAGFLGLWCIYSTLRRGEWLSG